MAGAQHLLPAASAVELAPSCIGSSFPLDPASVAERGDTVVWAAQRLLILAQTGEGTPAVSQDSGTTRNEAVYRF